MQVFVSHFDPGFERHMERFRDAAPGARFRWFDTRDALEAEVADADIVAGLIKADALARAKRVKWIHSWSAGPNHYAYPEMQAHPVPLTCSKGNGAVPLAEHAILLMLMLARDMRRWLRAQSECRWDTYEFNELQGKTLGIIGLGHSGKDLALKAKGFHMKVLATRRRPQATPNVDCVYAPEQLRDMLPECDFVVVTAPINAQTRGMFDRAAFAAMKNSAYYICFSRGEIAQDDALLDALRSHQIAGAGLDAHSVEPLPDDSPFWTLPNTIITPHCGASAVETPLRSVEIFCENLRRFQAGEPLLNLVDKTHWY